MHCFIIVALTADGFIGRDVAHNSTRWTSKEDAAWFNQRSKQAGAVVMGRATYDTINKPLPDRVTIVYSRDADEARLVKNQSKLEKNQIYYTQAKPKDLLNKLDELGFNEVAICGGSSIYTMFMQAGVTDKLYLTVEPVLFGDGIKLFNKKLNIKLKLKSVKQLSSQTILLEYIVD
ncbi:dihydrofolate reductase family protein [Patescibacteria group bacterium]|nr:dihydrofolate reductase family protein [Patescibacteria group bacterium]MBU1885631.1 dihydrofolate reductase family protein [Patescibacteria group bacterium]